MSVTPHLAVARWLLGTTLGLGVAACAGTTPSAEHAPAEGAPAASEVALPTDAFFSESLSASSARGAKEVPTRCADESAPTCTPPTDFVERLCDRTTPDLALTLFARGTPWTRAYVQRDMEAWYTRARSSPKQLRFAEEVIIVADHATTASGVQVSGSGSFDVYRWDGTCVSLMSDEITQRRPSTPEVAVIAWKRLDEGVRDALEKDQKISYRNDQRRDACKEQSASSRRACERAELGLSRMIAEYVRGGGEVPPPKLLP
jgi:hypothetical protein